jgi:hypothetical protein
MARNERSLALLRQIIPKIQNGKYEMKPRWSMALLNDWPLKSIGKLNLICADWLLKLQSNNFIWES